MNLYLIRHAPVVSHRGIIYGDDASVDIQTVQHEIDALSHHLSRMTEKSHWYYSGVDRTLKTALAVLDSNNADHELMVHNGFKEQHFGDLIGKKHDAVNDHVTFHNGKILSNNPPNGETIQCFISRIDHSLQNVCEKAKHNNISNIVIFAHGGTIRAVDVIIDQKNTERFIDLDTPPLFLYTALYQAAFFLPR